MATTTFESQLMSALSAGSPAPYTKAFDAISEVARSLQVSLASPDSKFPIRVQVEPGFPAEIGQQFNIVVHIPERHVTDTLFRAYTAPDGRIALDLFGEEPLPVTDEQDLQHQILQFINRPEVKSRLMIYKKLSQA
jgi:hypothetical protein